MRVTVFGLWHLGSVTAACLAEAGHEVVGLDPDENVIADLRQAKPPIHEPGLADLVAEGLKRGKLTFSADAAAACKEADVLWVAFDTPVNDEDEADVGWVRGQLDAVVPLLRPGACVLISSQVPAGFTASLERACVDRGLSFACSPENLRLGKALECFRHPERIVVGCRGESERRRLANLLEPFCRNIVWMSIESAEMTKHAVNAFLGTSVTFINELARICEAVGADAKEVEQGLKSEKRIGPGAYLSPGAAFAGGTLARDLRFLMDLADRGGVQAPMFRGVWAGNQEHKDWVRGQVARLLADAEAPIVAILGLTYKAGTSTLRRSSALELCSWLHDQGVSVRAHDPAVQAMPPELNDVASLCDSASAALAGADIAVIGTDWPQFRSLSGDQLVAWMRRPQVVDPNHFLAAVLAEDPRVMYVATGKRVRCCA